VCCADRPDPHAFAKLRCEFVDEGRQLLLVCFQGQDGLDHGDAEPSGVAAPDRLLGIFVGLGGLRLMDFNRCSLSALRHNTRSVSSPVGSGARSRLMGLVLAVVKSRRAPSRMPQRLTVPVGAGDGKAVSIEAEHLKRSEMASIGSDFPRRRSALRGRSTSTTGSPAN
jgi:hypothetical protein